MKKLILAAVLSLSTFSAFAENTFIYSTRDVATTMDSKSFKGKVGGQTVNCSAQNSSVQESEIYFVYKCKKPYTIGVVLDRKTMNSVVLLSTGDMKKAKQYPVLMSETTYVK